MATAISGCIIARENDNGSVDYYERCEDCGHTSSVRIILQFSKLM